VSNEAVQERKRSRKVLAFWAAAMVLLALVVLFSAFFAGPMYQARKAADRVAGGELEPADAVEDIGGPGAAASRMRLVLAMPDWSLPAGDEGVKLRAAAVAILAAAVGERGVVSDAPGSPLSVIREVLGRDRDPVIRSLALRALWVTKKFRPEDAQAGLADSSPSVRVGAVVVADRLNMVALLIQALNDADLAVSEQACWALVKRGNRRATGVLVEMLSSGGYMRMRRAERQLDDWYHGRFRGGEPGQSWSDSVVTGRWKSWWERNRDQIDERFTLPVRRGDTLSGVAAQVYEGRLRSWSLEDKWRAILAANPGVDPQRLQIGSELTIPLNPDKPPPPRRTVTP
jgi:hypothetical protein